MSRPQTVTRCLSTVFVPLDVFDELVIHAAPDAAVAPCTLLKIGDAVLMPQWMYLELVDEAGAGDLYGATVEIEAA